MRLFCGCILWPAGDEDDADAGDDIWPGIIWIFCDLNAFANLLSDFMMILLSANGTKLMLLLVMVCCDSMFIFGGIRWAVVVCVVVAATVVDDMTLLFFCNANWDNVDLGAPFVRLEFSSLTFGLATAAAVAFVNFGADNCCW